MKKTKIIKSFFVLVGPALILLILALLAFGDLFGTEYKKGFFVMFLFLVYPMIFFFQGRAYSLGKSNIFALIFSFSTVIIIIYMFMNSTATIYLVMYAISCAAGYLSDIIYKRRIEKGKNNK